MIVLCIYIYIYDAYLPSAACDSNPHGVGALLRVGQEDDFEDAKALQTGIFGLLYTGE